jgi:hypothetical protein
MAEISGSINIGQSLFLVDEKLSKGKGRSLSNAFENAQMVSDLNTMSNIGQGMSGQRAAYLNQARMSTWYQDNGSAPLLTFSNQFGLNTMGGNYNPDVITGARVLPSEVKKAYTLVGTPVQSPESILNSVEPYCTNGICYPSFSKGPKVNQMYGN